ncbi:hypothetical protein QTP88_006352 [Uroleucon formosanum]
MSKLLFIRNIRGLDEPSLRQIINSKNLPCGTIMFKSGGACATVDFMEPSTAEYALTQLNGMPLQDQTLVVEPYNGLHSQMVKKASEEGRRRRIIFLSVVLPNVTMEFDVCEYACVRVFVCAYMCGGGRVFV